MKKSFLLFFVCLTFFTSHVAAQMKATFSETPDAFLKELGDYVNMSKRADVDKTFKDFSAKFRTLSDKEMPRVISACNAMLTYKLPAMPYYMDYMQSVVGLEASSSKDVSRLTEWSNIVDEMIKNIQNRRFETLRDYLAFSKDFFGKNALVYSEQSISWLGNSKDYTLKYDKGIPSIEWKKLSLNARFKTDSIQILETAGIYFPLEHQWKGMGGKVTWERFKNNDTYGLLNEYSIDMVKASYKAEKAKLHYPMMFPDRDLEGILEDKLMVRNDKVEGSYPRFESYDKKLKINNLGGNIQYEGGFKLQGTTVFGYGTKEDQARLSMNDKKRGTRNFRAAAINFIIRKGENIIAEQAESVIYFGKDSIFHPSVNLKLDIKTDQLVLERGQRGSDRSPFFNSYTQMTFDVGKIKWNIEKDSFVIGDKYPGFGTNTNNAKFESLNFFSDFDYRKLQNVASKNPIAIIKLHAERAQKKIFTADEVARQINDKLDASMIQSLFYDMAAQGFISYDVDKQLIEVKDKLFHYAAASQKKSDYDVLRIASETKQENAFFSLADTAILVNGVNTVELSAKQKVRLIPSKEEIKLRHNRDFDFDGRLFSGYGVFYGKKYHFDYEKFEVKMDSARFLDLYLKTGEDKFGKPVASALNSRLEHLTGVLLIDAPNNKSGKEDIKLFPSFQSKDNSYVFYDAKEIQDSIYKRDSFYFKLDRFNLDGMDSLTNADLKFKGDMVSANIFPKFRETLRLMPDSSLGFISKTPPNGYPLYSNKGNFNGEIDLSNKGFLGKGIVKYLDASIESFDIVFYPKQMKASAKNFELKENREKNVPQVVGPGVNINWKPYVDSLYISARDTAFKFFKEGEYTLRSTIIVTPSGVKGKGTFDWDKGTLTSDLFSFGTRSVAADTMNMSIRALDKNAVASAEEQLAFDTKNIQGKIDFDEQKGRFKANSDDIQTYMPGVKYKTSINEFDWDLKQEQIVFKSDGRNATFLCIDKEQDSLQYTGNRAIYELKSNALKVGGVPFIRTCDAFIYPSDENVQVTLGGKMGTLDSARIVVDTVTRHHVINRAKVDIKGRKLFEGSGYYEYNIGNKQQEIKFDNIVGQRVGKGQRSEKKTETRATGEVTQENEFKIDHKTLYKGKISLFSSSKNLQFEGYAKLDLENLPDKQWFSLNCFADKSDLAILYKTPKNEGGEPLETGVFISKENSASYPRLMMPLHFRKDRAIIDVKGLLKYNPKTDEAICGDSAKIALGAVQGNKFIFNNKTNSVYGEGKLNLGSGLKYVTSTAAGRLKTSFLKPSEEATDSSGVKGSPLSIEAMIGLNMIIPEKLLKIMAVDIQSGSFDATDVDYNKDDFAEKTLSEFITEKEDYQKVITNMKAKTLELPDKYNKNNFFFSRVPMKWNQETQSFISNAKKIDLNSVGGILINKQANAFIEYRMPSNEDDRVYVYIKTAYDYFYFFGYQRGVLSITSNNPKLEEEFNKIKPKERIIKMADNQPFEMQWAEPGTAEMFVRRVTAAQK